MCAKPESWIIMLYGLRTCLQITWLLFQKRKHDILLESDGGKIHSCTISCTLLYAIEHYKKWHIFAWIIFWIMLSVGQWLFEEQCWLMFWTVVLISTVLCFWWIKKSMVCSIKDLTKKYLPTLLYILGRCNLA